MRSLRLALFATAASTVLAPIAWACAFHGYTPRPTLIDLLYDSEQIVLARPDPANPARFVAVEALAGPLDLVELPQQPDRATRAALRAQPDAAVLFARDGSYGPWVQHDVVGPDVRGVLDTALSRQDRWQGGTDKTRAQFFAAQLTHPDAAVRQLALLELDRVEYATLRSLRIKGLAAQVAALESGEDKLRPIRILLTGLAGDMRMVPVLTDGVRGAVSGNRRYVGAYTTALIELQGAQAVEALAAGYLASPDMPADRRELMIEAFALQGLYGSRAVKRAVKRSLGNVLANDPQLAGAVARQFSRHGNWSMAKAVQAAQRAAPPAAAKDAVPIAKYLAFAKQ